MVDHTLDGVHSQHEDVAHIQREEGADIQHVDVAHILLGEAVVVVVLVDKVAAGHLLADTDLEANKKQNTYLINHVHELILIILKF